MWHGHLTLNQKQNWLYLVLIFRHSDWRGTEIIILRLHIKCIFCQAWFQFYLPCNHVGFKEKPTERAARSCAKRIVQLMLPKPSKITHNFHLTRRAMWHGHLALNQKQNWLVSGAYLQTHSDWSGTEIIILRLHIKCIFCQDWFRFYLPCNHVGFKEKPTGRAARSCAKRIVQLMLPKPSKITHNFHLTRRAMWHGHLALNQKQNWLVSGAYLQTHSDWSGTEIIILRLHIKCIFCQAWFQFYLPCNHAGFKEKPTGRAARSCAKRIVQLMLPKPSKITHNFHLTRRAMWHGHLALNQKQNWLVSGAYLQTHSDWSGTEIIILRLHIKCIFCQAWFRFCPPCNHVGFKEKPTERVARSCAKRIKNKAPLPSDKTCYVAWTSNAQSEAELACIWCLSSDIQTGAAQKSSSWDFISSASSVKLGFDSTCLATMLDSRKNQQGVLPGHVPKESCNSCYPSHQK